MRVLMFGWEFPPFNQGGLGTACHGLTKGLANNGINVTVVLPQHPDGIVIPHVDFLVPSDNLRMRRVPAFFLPYDTPNAYLTRRNAHEARSLYGKDLFQEVYRYAMAIGELVKAHPFEIIHAHDWMTFPAGMLVKQETHKPMIVHVHATEFDRGGGNCNPVVYNIERAGMHAADHIITVSNYTKNMVVQHYGVQPEKISVVYNALDHSLFDPSLSFSPLDEFSSRWTDEKVVLFLGRMTLQKGPDYFLYAAKKVLELDDKVSFIMAGSGDMEGYLINKAAALGIGHKIFFTGQLRGQEISKIYRMADLYVMPSVSEPFGITPLEALYHNVPVIISKQSGVSEVLHHCLKVDFWDIDALVNVMHAVLHHQPLHDCLSSNGKEEVQGFQWDTAAIRCISVYDQVLQQSRLRGVS